MDIAEFQKTEKLPEATQQSKISHALNDALEIFDVLLSKINRHIFKYGYLYFLTSYFLYILGSAFSITFICYSHQTCNPHVKSGEWPIPMFFENLGSIPTGRLGLT